MKACAFVLTIIYAAARAAPAGAVQLTAENWDDETDGVCNFVCVRYQVPSLGSQCPSIKFAHW